MESLGYTLIYFLIGLPWQSLKIERKDRRRVIGLVKAKLSIADLTDSLPEEFSTYMRYTRGLRFQDEPDYSYLKSLFYSIIFREKN